MSDIKRDAFLDTLILLRKDIKRDNTYSIQLYSGLRKEADSILNVFQRYFDNVPGEVIFETPNYKVRIGKYPTRLEADRELLIYKRKFKGAFIF